MKVYVVMERGEELPHSVWTNREEAETKAKEHGSPEDCTVEEYELAGKPQ